MTSTTRDVRVPRSSAVSYVTTPIIRVLVGIQDQGQQEFFVHEGLICARSEFFKNAMKEPWKEAEEHKVTLAEEEPAVFALYLELLYTGLLFTKEPTENSWEYSKLCKIYVLAEMLMDDRTKEIILSETINKVEETPPTEILYGPDIPSIKDVYGGTPNGDPLRSLLVKLSTERNLTDPSILLSEELPGDFLSELSLSMMINRVPRSQSDGLQVLLAQKDKDHKTLVTAKDKDMQGLKDQVGTLEDELRSLKLKRGRNMGDVGRSGRVVVQGIR